MSPPNLSRNAPISNIAHPLIPYFFMFFRQNLHLFILHFFNQDFSNIFAFYVPLGSHERFDYILAFGTETQSHRVRLFPSIQPQLFQFLSQQIPDIVSFHPSEFSSVFIYFSVVV
jgi:hypothetical protein